MFLNSFDFLGIDVIANEVPMLKKAMVSECDGVYCGEPFYIPVRHVIRYVTTLGIVLTCTNASQTFNWSYSQ